jgi:hypothetical protein
MKKIAKAWLTIHSVKQRTDDSPNNAAFHTVDTPFTRGILQ